MALSPTRGDSQINQTDLDTQHQEVTKSLKARCKLLESGATFNQVVGLMVLVLAVAAIATHGFALLGVGLLLTGVALYAKGAQHLKERQIIMMMEDYNPEDPELASSNLRETLELGAELLKEDVKRTMAQMNQDSERGFSKIMSNVGQTWKSIEAQARELVFKR